MNILLNGESHNVADHSTLQDLIDSMELTGRRIAVEVNLEIVPRSSYATHPLADGDRIELVHAIGGG